VLLNPKVYHILFQNSEYSFENVLEMKTTNSIKSFPLNSKFSFWGEFKQRDFVSPNIVGFVEGSKDDLKDSYLIISAHYDHLGIGLPVAGDSIYNGALDNAIGVSVLLELARSFSELEKTPGRSILFLCVTAEEKGLLGSTYYIDHPIVPLHKTIANINIDGVAFFRDFASIVAIGSEYSTMDGFVNKIAGNLNLTVEKIPDPFNQYEAFNRSDQISFASAGIPSLLILEGLKNKSKSEAEVLNSFISYMENKYHTPFDDLNQSIDYEAAVNFTKVLYDLIWELTSSDTLPEWKEGAPYIHERLRTIAEDK
jgi:Zn-dependent M28 family amino/carboxypeptidase